MGAAVDPLKDHLRLVGKQSAVPGFLLVILDEETLKEHVVFSFDSFIFGWFHLREEIANSATIFFFLSILFTF